MNAIGLLIKRFLSFIVWCYEEVFEPDQRNQIPPVRDPILLLRATEIAERIKQKKIKAEDVIKAYLRRIDEVNPKINAIVEIRKEAVEDAKKIDQLLSEKGDEARNENGDRLMDLPLLGVPFTSKDGLALAGMKWTAGMLSRKDERAKADCGVIRNLRKAGAIPMGVGNVSEMHLFIDTSNKVYGRTRNPYDLSRSPGGSTGGDGAALTSCCSVIAVGSDLAGSCRIPASHNGVFGHKISNGVVEVEDEFPANIMTEYGRKAMLSLGPLTRYATDLNVVMKAMAGDTYKNLLRPCPKVDFSKIRIYYMEGDNGPIKSPLNTEMRLALRRLVTHLETKYKLICNEHNFEGFNQSSEITTACLKKILKPNALEPIGSTSLFNIIPQIFKYMLGSSPYTFPSLIMMLILRLLPPTSSCSHLKLMEIRKKLKIEFSKLLGNDGVFLFPSYPTTSLKPKSTFLSFLDAGYLSAFNVLGVPATVCPMGLSSDGLPLGVQIAANPSNDHLTLAIAEEIEKHFGGWVPPCEVLT